MFAQPGGLGEEDMVTLVLPYAKSARDGVRILGEPARALRYLREQRHRL